MNEKLPAWRKWMYGSGDLGFSITTTIIYAYFAIFLTDVIGVRAEIVAIAFFIGRTWDYINDPIFGYISDRTHTRWGRRRPYLLFGPIPFAIVFALMWWKPPIQGEIGLVIYYTIMFVLFDAAATMCYMPFFALTPELTQDYDERTSLMSARAFFSIIGSLLAYPIPLMIIGGFSPDHSANVLRMGIIFAIVSAIPLYVVFFGTKERPEFIIQRQPGLRESIRSSLKNRPFIFGAGIYLFTWFSVDLLMFILIYFIKHVVNRESQADLITAVIFIVAIIALPLWTWTSRRLNKRKAYILGMAFLAAVLMVLINVNAATPMSFILIYFIKHVVNRESQADLITAVIFIVAIIALPLWTWTSRKLNKRKAYILGLAFLAAVLMVLINVNAATPMSFILILCVLAGIGVSAAHVIPWSIIPDAIEYGELKTGERHEGMFYSLISLSQKIASSFAMPLGLLILGRSGYIPNSVQQPASAILGIRIVTGPIPAVMICFGILFAIFYPLGREGYTKITRELEERRAAVKQNP